MFDEVFRQFFQATPVAQAFNAGLGAQPHECADARGLAAWFRGFARACKEARGAGE